MRPLRLPASERLRAGLSGVWRPLTVTHTPLRGRMIHGLRACSIPRALARPVAATPGPLCLHYFYKTWRTAPDVIRRAA